MNFRWQWKWLIAALPAALSILAAIAIGAGWLPHPVILIRISLANLVLFAGFLLTCLAAIIVAIFAEREWRQLYRQQLQMQSADERRRFLRRLDHELKNPLTAIRAGLVNLSETPDKAARREAQESVETQVLRLSRLSADLRKLAELETRPLERAPVDLAAMLQEAFSLAQDRPEAANLRLTLTLPQAPWPLPTISGDQDLLFLALHNLLDNAIKYAKTGNTIEVRAFEDGNFVVLEVADTGPGIPEEELPHVWEELYRGQGARAIQGSGLGLALVRAIAERHGGQTTLRSRLGQGTVVTLRLPVG